MATTTQKQDALARGTLGWRKSVEATFGLDYGIMRGFLIEADGDVAVTFEDDTTATYTGLKGGQYYPCQAKKINSSGTTLTAGQIHVLDPAATS